MGLIVLLLPTDIVAMMAESFLQMPGRAISPWRWCRSSLRGRR